MKLPQKGFWTKVEKTETCWLWLGYKIADGYGRICTTYKGKKANVLVHRLAYEEFKGPIPKGLEIDHLCSVRNCVNPDHLEAVTHKVNCERGDYSPQGRAAKERVNTKTHCPQGHPYSGKNLYMCPRGDGGFSRICRTCNTQHNKEFRERQKLLR